MLQKGNNISQKEFDAYNEICRELLMMGDDIEKFMDFRPEEYFKYITEDEIVERIKRFKD